jgi:hypothetical protein
MIESVDAIDGAIIRAGMISIVMFIGCFAMCLAAISITICRGNRNERRSDNRRNTTSVRRSNHSRHEHIENAHRSNHTRIENAREIAANACDVALARLHDKNEDTIV